MATQKLFHDSEIDPLLLDASNLPKKNNINIYEGEGREAAFL